MKIESEEGHVLEVTVHDVVVHQHIHHYDVIRALVQDPDHALTTSVYVYSPPDNTTNTVSDLCIFTLNYCSFEKQFHSNKIFSKCIQIEKETNCFLFFKMKTAIQKVGLEYFVILRRIIRRK